MKITRSLQPPSSGSPGRHLRRVGLAALVALAAGLTVIVIGQGLSVSGPIKVIEEMALGVVVIAALTGLAAFAAVRLAGWRDPESEMEFEEVVLRSERLARE